MYSKEDIHELMAETKALFKGTEDIEALRKILRFHEYKYYVENDPLISDPEYDSLYKNLEKLEKDHPELITPDSPTQRVGADLNKDFQTVSHLVPMLSLENSYNTRDVLEWNGRLTGIIGRQPVHFSVEPKYDGAGISLIYENNLLVRGATRGDGIEGDDITANLRQIGSIPLSASFSDYGIKKIEIRGECLLNKQNFRLFNESLVQEGIAPLANPRNAAAGSLRMKDPAAVRKRKLEAVLYHVSFIEFEGKTHPEFETQSKTIRALADLGFKTPADTMKVFEKVEDVVQYCNDFESQRDTLPYEIDGLVIKVNEFKYQREAGSTSHHPRWAMAYKFKAREATSKLLNVDFQVGRTGAVTPVAKIEPVHIGGVTVSSVSLFNEGILREKDLRIGDTVIVQRAGDVIPNIVKSLTELREGSEKEIVFPQNCPVCNHKLVKPDSEVVWRCTNIDCPAQVIERLIHFVSKDAMDIRSLGESNIRKFHDLKLITDIPSIYKMDFGAIGKLEGFGKKSVDNLRTAIEKSKSQPLNRLIFGLGVRYVGEATAKELAKNVNAIYDLTEMNVERLQQMKDIGQKVSETIFEFFHDAHNISLIKALESYGVNIKGIRETAVEGGLSGKTFLFTGTLSSMKRGDAEKLAEDHGGKLLSSVSANLNYLVTGEAAGSKLEKAKKYKSIQIITEEEFLNLIKSNS